MREGEREGGRKGQQEEGGYLEKGQYMADEAAAIALPVYPGGELPPECRLDCDGLLGLQHVLLLLLDQRLH